jgi:hypothetical protein
LRRGKNTTPDGLPEQTRHLANSTLGWTAH